MYPSFTVENQRIRYTTLNFPSYVSVILNLPTALQTVRNFLPCILPFVVSTK